MALEYAKLWLQQTLTRIGDHSAVSLDHRKGWSLPCTVTAVNGRLVTVKFNINNAPFTLPEIEIPKAESPWITAPTQVGDVGMTVPADAYIGAITGQGIGEANLTQPFSLSELVFVPVSKANDPPVDQNAAQVQGPNGVILQTTQGTTSKVVTDQNGTMVTYGSNTAVVNSSGAKITVGSTTVTISSSSISFTAGGKTVTLDASGFTIDGILFETHEHSGVTTGSGTSGPPV